MLKLPDVCLYSRKKELGITKNSNTVSYSMIFLTFQSWLTKDIIYIIFFQIYPEKRSETIMICYLALEYFLSESQTFKHLD